MGTKGFTQEEALRKFKYIDGKIYAEVGGSNSNGYRVISSGNKRILEHRLVFLMHHGFIPDVIDHIDGNKSNNRIENLREATKSQNCCNQGGNRKNNTSGSRNVTWHKRIKKWAVSIVSNKVRRFIGYFDDFELAELVAAEARAKYHGAFARKEA